MPDYNVTLSRAYSVHVKARNRTLAKRVVEFFLNDPTDGSLDDPGARRKYGFTIKDIEMVENDAIQAEEVT